MFIGWWIIPLFLTLVVIISAFLLVSSEVENFAEVPILIILFSTPLLFIIWASYLVVRLLLDIV